MQFSFETRTLQVENLSSPGCFPSSPYGSCALLGVVASWYWRKDARYVVGMEVPLASRDRTLFEMLFFSCLEPQPAHSAVGILVDQYHMETLQRINVLWEKKSRLVHAANDGKRVEEV